MDRGPGRQAKACQYRHVAMVGSRTRPEEVLPEKGNSFSALHSSKSKSGINDAWITGCEASFAALYEDSLRVAMEMSDRCIQPMDQPSADARVVSRVTRVSPRPRKCTWVLASKPRRRWHLNRADKSETNGRATSHA